MHTFLLILGGFSAATASLGYLIDKSGEGINDTGTGALKIAAAGLAIYFVINKSGVLKT